MTFLLYLFVIFILISAFLQASDNPQSFLLGCLQ